MHLALAIGCFHDFTRARLGNFVVYFGISVSGYRFVPVNLLAAMLNH